MVRQKPLFDLIRTANLATKSFFLKLGPAAIWRLRIVFDVTELCEYKARPQKKRSVTVWDSADRLGSLK